MNDSSNFLLATRAALAQAGQILVQYSFSIVGAVVLLLVGWIAARYLHRWALNGMSRVHGFDVTLAHFLANIIRYAIMIMVLIAVLGQFGVQTASILAALGAAGLAIGLALQGTLQNIAAGIMLLILRPFRVGETIETNNVSGTIEEIGLFATELRTGDGLYLLAPNSTLWNTPVKNYSRLPTRSLSIKAVLPAGLDLRDGEDLLMRIAKRDTRVRSTPAPTTSVDDMTDTLTITLTVWLNTGDYGGASRDISKSVKILADRLRTGSAPAALEPEIVQDEEQTAPAAPAKQHH